MPSKTKQTEDIRKSIEYRRFIEEERYKTTPQGIYEKLCRSAAKINIEPDKKAKEKLQESIDFCHLRITPAGSTSLTFLVALAIFLPLTGLFCMSLFGLIGISLGYLILGFFISIPIIFYVYIYPHHLKTKYELEVGSAIVSFVLYVATFMRDTPNLEQALRFSEENLSGKLSYEIKKLFWDIEIGNYFNTEDALLDYSRKWRKNREFSQSIELIVSSLQQTADRRVETLNEAIEMVLEGNREQSHHFAQSLKTPVMVLHAMGIILPVLGLVLFPVVAVFLHVGSTALFIGYDIILPLALFFFISTILEKRPATFSRIDISDHPDTPKPGTFRHGKRYFKAWPFIFIVAAPFFVFAYFTWLAAVDPGNMFTAILILGGVTFGIAAYYYLETYQSMTIRTKTREIEEEFAGSLFHLGNQVYSGIPMEIALDTSLKRIRNLRIKELFSRALHNIRSLGFTFGQAFFDKTYGAVRFYPSRLIKTVMRIVVESSKKGSRTASMAMLAVAKYLRNVHQTQEDVRSEMDETVSSMKFQLYILSPFIAGVIVTLTLIMLAILSNVGASVTGVVDVPFLTQLSSVGITPFEFIMVVGIYMIQTSFLLAYFINGIESGYDDIGRKHTTAVSLIMSFIVFAIVFFTTFVIFEPLVILAVPGG